MNTVEAEKANKQHSLSYQPEKYWDRLFAPASNVAIITTVDKDGRVNAGAFATCVRIVHNPVQIAFTAGVTGGTIENVETTGQFVVSLPSFDRAVLEKVRVVGVPFAAGVNELEISGLTAIPSATVTPPRVAECPRHFECELEWIKEWLNRKMVVGNVTACSTRDDCVDEKGYVRWDVVRPVAWCGTQYVNSFVSQDELLTVDMLYKGPEVAKTDSELRAFYDSL
jgi:flavin reductase (DIM6/NTAB) family NADH-FMN oxidoreductase RutF